MSAPRVHGPRDVPELRLWLLDQWQPGRPYYEASRSTRRVSAHVSWMEAPFDQRALREGALWYVSAEMVDLVAHAALTLDDVKLERSLVPERAALVVLGRPLVGVDADTPTKPVKVDALLWGQGILELGADGTALPYYGDAGGEDVVGVSLYQRMNFADGLSPDELSHAVNTGAMSHGDPKHVERTRRGAEVTTTLMLDGDTWVPLGRTDWRYGDAATVKVLPEVSDERNRSQIEDRLWLAALWLLASQPNIVDVEATAAVDRPTQRRSLRRGVTSAVRLVDLRRPHSEHEHPSEQTTAREWSRRWMVSGHWRQQVCGPGRSQRRPTWIAPYVKGPEDKPLVVRPTVKVVR